MAQKEFVSLVTEAQLVAGTSLQAALNAVDRAARSVAMAVIMRWASWLQGLGFAKELQSTVEESTL